MDQCVGDFVMGTGQNSRNGRSVDAHAPGNLYLAELLKVRQTHGFDFIHGQTHAFLCQ